MILRIKFKLFAGRLKDEASKTKTYKSRMANIQNKEDCQHGPGLRNYCVWIHLIHGNVLNIYFNILYLQKLSINLTNM